MRKKFFIYGFLLFLIVLAVYLYTKRGFLLVIILPILLVVGVYNATQTKHAILRNFPVLGYFRYLFEMIAPEIQQYFIERSTDGKPFSRNQRSMEIGRAHV